MATYREMVADLRRLRCWVHWSGLGGFDRVSRCLLLCVSLAGVELDVIANLLCDVVGTLFDIDCMKVVMVCVVGEERVDIACSFVLRIGRHAAL